MDTNGVDDIMVHEEQMKPCFENHFSSEADADTNG